MTVKEDDNEVAAARRHLYMSNQLPFPSTRSRNSLSSLKNYNVKNRSILKYQIYRDGKKKSAFLSHYKIVVIFNGIYPNNTWEMRISEKTFTLHALVLFGFRRKDDQIRMFFLTYKPSALQREWSLKITAHIRVSSHVGVKEQTNKYLNTQTDLNT